MAGRREMRAVELVEDAPDDAPDGPPGDASSAGGGGLPASGRAAAPASRRPSRRRRTAVAALVVALGLGALGGAALGDRREDARLDALVGVPDIVAPLDGPVAALWRGRGWTGSDLRDVAGRLVGAVSTPYGTVDVVALDPRTGADVWRTPVGPAAVSGLRTDCVVPGAPYPGPPPGARTDASTDPPANPAGDLATGALSGTRVDGAPAPVVVCVAVDRTVTTEQSALGSRTYPTRVRLVAVDALDGTLLRDGPAPATSRVRALGTDVVLAHVEPDGRARMTRVDPRTGAERWSFTTPGEVPPDRFGQRAVEVEVAGDVIALVGGATWVLSGDGDVLRTWPRDALPGNGSPVTLLAGGRAVARTAALADGGWGTEVVDLDGGTTWSAPGFPVLTRPDDGSLDGLVLLQPDGSQVIRAHDRTTGDLRWGLHLPSLVQPAVLDGRLLGVAPGRELRAVDGRTGTPLWTTALERPPQGRLVSDGRLVLVSSSTVEGGGELTAVGLDDGRARWSTAVEHALFLFAVDGRLYGWSARGLQALGPPSPPGQPSTEGPTS